MAMAPVDRLMYPEPRKVATTPSEMPAMSAPEPSPSRMKSRIVSTGSFLGQCFRYVKCSGVSLRFQGRGDREGESPAVAARRSAVADHWAGGWVQPAALIHWFLPPYVKNCERLLQTPGALGL